MAWPNSFFMLQAPVLGLGLSALVLAGTAMRGEPTASVVLAPATAARAELGRLLFFEPALSVNGKRSCASCHRPEKAFSDRRIVARALRFGDNLDRNSPTLYYAAEQPTFFHDGRAGSLAATVRDVLHNPREMGSSYPLVAGRLASSPEYQQRFAEAFGPVAKPDSATLTAALVAYMRTLAPWASAYDEAARPGGLALPAEAAAGARVFRAAGCGGCHGGPLFRDDRRHEIGPGLLVKTPTLRNVALTMPYGAQGRYRTLPELLASPYHQAQQPHPLNPPDQARLLAFLDALSDPDVGHSPAPAQLPELPDWPNRPIGGSY